MAVKKYLAEGKEDLEPLLSEVYLYAENFTFGRKSGPPSTAMVEARRIAQAHLRAKGRIGSAMTQEEIEPLVLAYLQANPEIEIEAARRAKVLQDLAVESMDNLEI